MDSGVPSTPFFVNSGLEQAWCFITYCFPRRSEHEPFNLAGGDYTIKDFGQLYEFYLREHIPKCLEMGGEVVLVFGTEAKESFQELLWEGPNNCKDAQCPNIIHGKVLLDVEVVTYSNSKLVLKNLGSRHSPDDIRHVIIYVPDPCPFIENIPLSRQPIPTTPWAMKTSAPIDFAALLIGEELPHSFVWRAPSPVFGY